MSSTAGDGGLRGRQQRQALSACRGAQATVENGHRVHGWVRLARHERTRKLHSVCATQSVSPHARYRAHDDRVSDRHHGEAATTGVGDERPVERGGLLVVEFAARCFPPHGGQHLRQRQGADRDESRPPARLGCSVLIGIELDKRRTVPQRAQRRPSLTRSWSGVPRPAAARARSSSRALGAGAPDRADKSKINPARASRSCSASCSLPEFVGSVAAATKSSNVRLTLLPRAAASRRTASPCSSLSRTENCCMLSC